MLLALVLFFDNRKLKDVNVPSDVSPSKRRNYVWYAITGYGIGLVAALAAGILSRSPQPALLYLVSPVWLYSQIFFSCCWIMLLWLGYTHQLVSNLGKLDLQAMVVCLYHACSFWWSLLVSGSIDTRACHVLVMVTERAAGAMGRAWADPKWESSFVGGLRSQGRIKKNWAHRPHGDLTWLNITSVPHNEGEYL